jgi:phage/plasmid-associated DNA primase
VNVLPTTPENVHGFYRRFEIIEFDVTIEEDKKDRQLPVKIILILTVRVLSLVPIAFFYLLSNGSVKKQQNIHCQKHPVFM